MNEDTPQQSQRANPLLNVAAVLSFVAGLWMLLGFTWMQGMNWDQMQEGHTMHTLRPWIWHHSFMGSYVPPMGWPWPGGIAGLAVLASAVLLWVNPRQRVVWGVIILASSALIFLTSMGGFVPGLLGIAGGILALVKTAEPSRSGEGPREPGPS